MMVPVILAVFMVVVVILLIGTRSPKPVPAPKKQVLTTEIKMRTEEPDLTLRNFEASEVLKFRSGEVIYRKGDPSTRVLMIQKGRVGLYCGSVRVGALRPGDPSGHVTSFFANGRRTRTAIAETDGSMAVMSLTGPLLAHCRETLAHALNVARFALTHWLVDDDDIESTVAKVDKQFLHGGETYTQGTVLDGMYLILEGEVSSRKRRGEVVGGLAFLGLCEEEKKRMVVTSPEATLVKIDEKTEKELLTACLKVAADEGRPVLERWAKCGLSRRFLRAGERLMEENTAFLVLSGRVRTFLEADEKIIGVRDFRRGDVVGLNDILTDHSKKKIEKYAARDTEVVVLPRTALEELVPAKCALNLVKRQLTLKETKSRATTVSLATVDATVICVVPVTKNARAKALGTALAATLSGKVLDSTDARAKFPEIFEGTSEDETRARRMATRWLADVEWTSQRVLLIADSDDSTWTRVAIASADALLFVADGQDDAVADLPLRASFPGAAPRQLLTVCHGPEITQPSNTRRFMRPSLDEPRVVHVRYNDEGFQQSDVGRLGRFLTGTARGLVLGGGGARGLAHLGALRALAEANVDIDCVMGCSQGAMIGLVAATEEGWPSGGEKSLKRTCQRLQKFARTLASPVMMLRDLNLLPFFAVSTFSGREFARAVASVFSSATEAMEDAWIPRYCVSTDITTAETRIHGCGDDAPQSCLASMSVVGYFPPVISRDGHLLVDGGYACNLPVAQMRAIVGEKGSVYAVDVEAKDSEKLLFNPCKFDWRHGISGLRALVAKYFDPTSHVSLAFLTSQLLYIRNTAAVRDGIAHVDLCLRLDNVQAFSFTAYDSVDTISSVAHGEATSLLRSKGLIETIHHQRPSTTRKKSPLRRLWSFPATIQKPAIVALVDAFLQDQPTRSPSVRLGLFRGNDLLDDKPPSWDDDNDLEVALTF